MDMKTRNKLYKAKELMKSEDKILPCKLRVGDYRKSGRLIYKRNRIEFDFGYWPALNKEIKAMEGHRYHGFEEINPRKIWSVANTLRNEFQIHFMLGMNPYLHYDADLLKFKAERPLYEHQLEMLGHVMTRRHCVLACEMGSGKSLVFIEAAERCGAADHEIWYVGPRSGIKAVERECRKWKAKFSPQWFTYRGLVKEIKNWDPGLAAPRFVCFDESSKIKGPTTQQSQAALHLANAVRKEHGLNGFVLLMSGTPAPRTPVDWWHQCEVACPGFIKEGTVGKFKARLSLVEMRQSITGGAYPHLITWLDDETKCKVCGKKQGHPDHAAINKGDEDYHSFTLSKNEVRFLYERMHGLVLVKFKRDCLDLPEKQYELIRVKPTIEIIRAVKLIQTRSTRAITALTLTREIADGFQYIEVPSGTKKCPNCHGLKTVEIHAPKDYIDKMAPTTNVDKEDFELKTVDCDNCNATGEVTVYSRDTEVVGSPKDQVFIEELDTHEDVGRYIVWGGFTGTLDRLVGICHQQGWATLCVDGRGYNARTPTGEILDADEMLDAMDRSDPRYNELRESYPKLCFVGHPQAGGMALTLTSSPTELFYSNVFNGEARMQAEDRGHRPGMDLNRGLTIKDLIMLPTDLLVLNNLKKKKKMQNLTMGELRDAFTDN